MADYNNRGGSKFGGGFGGGRPSFGGPRGGKPSFNKKPWDSRGSDRPVTLHKATCAECGNMAEVPFRPMQGKPVFCKDCFSKNGGAAANDRGGDRNDRAPKREFNARPPFAPRSEGSSRGNDDTKIQLEAMTAKLDRLVRAVESLTASVASAAKSNESKANLTETVAAVTSKIPKKKVVKKKK